MIDCGCDEILLPQGSNGVDGKNAFTVTTAQFVQPPANNPVTINVSDSLQNTNQWAIVGQIIRITDSGGRGGWYQVTSIVGTNQITAINLNYQPGSSGSGVNIQAGAGVSPAGLKGVDGQDGGVGLQGPVGPAPNLSIGNVSQLNPGNQPTVQVNGGGGNYTIDFGIPQGLPGASGSTLLTGFRISPFQTFPSSNVGQLSGLIPLQGFDPSVLCPIDGSAGRIKINLHCIRTTSITTNNSTDYFDLSFFIEQGLSAIEFKPSQSISSYFSKYQQQFIRGITCESNAASGSSVTTVSIEIIINRTTQTSFLYTVNYIWSNGASFSNVFGGIVTTGFDFASNIGGYKLNITNYGSSKPISIVGHLTMEKITSF